MMCLVQIYLSQVTIICLYLSQIFWVKVSIFRITINILVIDLLNLYFICMELFYMLIGIFMKCIIFQCNDKLFFVIFFSLILMSHVDT
jgi:hypothetical protein